VPGQRPRTFRLVSAWSRVGVIMGVTGGRKFVVLALLTACCDWAGHRSTRSE